MTRVLRQFTVVLALVGLALQPAAAAFAAACAHHAPHGQGHVAVEAVVAADAVGHDCDSHHGDQVTGAGHHDHATSHGADGDAPQGSCSQCGLCHLACSGMLPASARQASVPHTAENRAVPPASTFASHVGEHLLPPPRRI